MCNLVVSVFSLAPTLAHDEAEHLQTMFAIERGERPYLDFIENHPVSFHLILSGVRRLANAETGVTAYIAARTFVLIHALIATIVLFAVVVRWLSPRDWKQVLSPFFFAIALSGVWRVVPDWLWGHQSIWQLRPDWIYVTFSLLCLALHLRGVLLFTRNRPQEGWVVTVAAGIAGGYASGTLPKSFIFFLSYAITLAFAPVFFPRESREFLRTHARDLVAPNCAFLATGVLVYVLIVGIELYTTGVPLRTYLTANFVLNGIKHPPLGAEDFSAITLLSSLSGLGLTSGLLATFWFVKRTVDATRRRRVRLALGLLFCIVLIGVNSVVPSVSNGLNWPQYYIPSLLAFWALSTLAISDISDFVALRTKFARRIPWVMRASAISILAIVVAFKSAISIAQLERHRGMSSLRRSMMGTERLSFAPELYLPTDLTYLVFEPQDKPVRARAWGYFSMLAIDRNWWVDNFRHGIGPNPQTYWLQQFQDTPPDVVMLRDREQFQHRLVQLKQMQDTDITWLWSALESKYVCVQNRWMRFFVHARHADRFLRGPWRRCANMA